MNLYTLKNKTTNTIIGEFGNYDQCTKELWRLVELQGNNDTYAIKVDGNRYELLINQGEK